MYSHGFNPPFQQGKYINEFFSSRRSQMTRNILDYDADTVLANSEEKLYQYFLEKYSIDAPVLDKEGIYMEEEPQEVSVERRGRDPFEGRATTYIEKVLEFSIAIPFQGDREVLLYRPTRYSWSMSGDMDADVQDGFIRFKYRELAPENIESVYEGDVDRTIGNAENLTSDIEGFNQGLPPIIRKLVSDRKAQVNKNQRVIQSIPIPIKKRSDVPTNLAIPEIRKKPALLAKKVIPSGSEEHSLPPEQYENILTILQDMSVGMERSPKTYEKLDEEEIRDIFLIQLNGHYEGMATGETFNGEGKTDILIRYKNANVFVAECKFWKGEKQFLEAISQLFGYVTWRDTKTAILLFHKGKDLTTVLNQIENIVKNHPNYRGPYALESETLSKDVTIFSFKLTHPSDHGKEIVLTVMAFQVAGNK